MFLVSAGFQLSERERPPGVSDPSDSNRRPADTSRKPSRTMPPGQLLDPRFYCGFSSARASVILRNPASSTLNCLHCVYTERFLGTLICPLTALGRTEEAMRTLTKAAADTINHPPLAKRFKSN